MADPNDPCLACAIVAGEARTAGGLVRREDGFTIHALAGPSPLAGWLVVTSDRHARALYDLDDREAAALGRVAARVMRAQRAALGAEHVYAFAIGDALHHAHLHLVPRYADTPARLRGRGCFDASAGEMLEDGALAKAVARVRAALERA
jgi:diadenosine tetraphosphate (Ap4A) HIT family hydrolase